MSVHHILLGRVTCPWSSYRTPITYFSRVLLLTPSNTDCKGKNDRSNLLARASVRAPFTRPCKPDRDHPMTIAHPRPRARISRLRSQIQPAGPFRCRQVVILLTCRLMFLISILAKRIWRFIIGCGSKVLARSRGVSISNSMEAPCPSFSPSRTRFRAFLRDGIFSGTVVQAAVYQP